MTDQGGTKLTPMERVMEEFQGAVSDPVVFAMAHAIIDLRQKLKVIRRRLHGGGVSAADMMASLHRIFIGDLGVVGFREEYDGEPDAWEKVGIEAEAMRLRMIINTVERAASHYGIELTPANLEDPGISVRPTDAGVLLWKAIDAYVEKMSSDDLPYELTAIIDGLTDQIDQAIRLVRNEAITQTLKGTE